MLTDFRKTRVPDFHQQNAVVLDRKIVIALDQTDGTLIKSNLVLEGTRNAL